MSKSSKTHDRWLVAGKVESECVKRNPYLADEFGFPAPPTTAKTQFYLDAKDQLEREVITLYLRGAAALAEVRVVRLYEDADGIGFFLRKR